MTNLKRSRNTYWCDVLAGGSVGFHARVGQRYRTSDPYANAAAMHGIAKRDNKRLQAESRNCSPSLTRWLPVSYTRYMKRLRPPKRPPNSAQSLQISQTKIYCHKHQRTANTKEQNWSSIHLQPWLAHTRTGTGCCAGITGPHGAPPARKLHAVLDAGNKIISLTLSSVFSEPGQLTSSAYEVVMESGPCARGNIKGKVCRFPRSPADAALSPRSLGRSESLRKQEPCPPFTHYLFTFYTECPTHPVIGKTLPFVARSGLSADSTVTKRAASNHSDSSPTTSRVTLVDTGRNLALDQNSKYHGELGAIGSCPPRYTWVDHLLGVFCINVSKRMVHNEYIGPETPTSGIDSLAWPSPWILPVYVYPKAHNKGEAPVPNVAKCTIDTGNLQGNIVSREFVEDVLGYSVTDFHKLTKEEERGGTAITGDLHMPQGAIYLTWYHRNSTRVFRNMRFLVSPYGGCDLIIGARSIKQDKILNVPCLMNNIIIPETVSARPAGELHGKIWNIKNHITSTLQDDIDAKEEDGEDTRELDNRKRDLYAIYYAFSNILNILFGSGAENQDLDQKRSAADVEFGKIFTHPVSDMLKRELKLKEIEDGLKAELKYAQQIAPYDNNGDQNPNLRKRA